MRSRKIAVCCFVLALIISCVVATTLDCSVKPGCQIAKCDPAPAAWNSVGYDVTEYLSKTQFPITCETRNTVVEEDILGPNLERDEKKRNEDNRNIEAQLKEMQKINTQLQKRVEKMESNYLQVVQKIMNLERNAAMKTSNEHVVLNETDENTGTSELMKSSQNCEVFVDDTCYYTDVRNQYSITFTSAVNICRKSGSKIAQLRSNVTFEQISENLRAKIPEGNYTVSVWLGSTINTSTIQISAPDSFLKWYPNNPRAGNSNSPYSNIYITVARDKKHKYQGMVNYYPSLKRQGVVCEF
uniref:uncharacterized protein LOC120348648 isoform X1 n=1 Tax=Styela clava TaxID=7725 RepID=UPI00193A7739|nr:uncharacterized protein LOC120348648 isoform X1 [Styela clava]